MCELLNTLDKPYHIERVAIDGPEGVRNVRKALMIAFKAQIEEKGYCFIEILSPCPIYQRLSPVKALRFVSEEMAAYFPVRVFRNEGTIVDA